MVELLGIIAGFLTVICYIPQILKIIRTRKTNDISLISCVVLFIGIVLWLVYGFMKESIALIFTNIFASIFIGVIIFLKKKYE